jgi:phage shock protein PspC (stress-responsive transcriptional regulator)
MKCIAKFEPSFILKNLFMAADKRLKRSSDKMVAGVCGGIAEFLGWDSTLVRVGYILLSIFTIFSGVIAYLVLWIVMPAPDKLRQ